MRKLGDDDLKARGTMGPFEREAKLNIAFLLLPIILLLVLTFFGPCISKALK